MFKEVLYYTFIYPMESILGFIFGLISSAVGNYGISIIILSLFINFFLLKLIILADKKASRFHILHAKVSRKLDEFKSVFRGRELHAYTQILYKQNHYHPIFALNTLGSLILQIPFFLGILFLFLHLESLQGKSFLWIDDLSKPDMLNIFGLNIHILPILMTIFTLINVMISSTEKGARIQGIIITLIFLLLLYDMPSSLVLYWTSNMLFALCKSLWNISNKYSCKVKPKQSTQENMDCHANPCGLARNDETNQSHEVPPLEASSGVWGLKGNKGSELAIQAPLSPLKKDKTKDSIDYKNLTQILSTLFHSIFTPYYLLDSRIYKTYKNISIFAILNICFLVFVFSPFSVYSSDVSQFDSSQTYQTLGALFGYFLLWSFLFIYITSFFYKTRLLKLGVYGVSVVLVIGVVYTFVLNYNVITGESYSQMDNFVFKNPHNIPNILNKYVDLGVGIFACIVVWALLYFRKMKYINYIISITLIVVCASYLTKIQTELTNSNKQTKTSNIESKQPIDLLPSYHKAMMTFSKKEQNILVLLFDGFSGSHLEIIFHQFPELKKSFEGFIYYPNTISLDGHTTRTAHTILTGHNTSAFALRESSLEEYDAKVNLALKAFYANLANAGFEVQSFGMPHIAKTDSTNNIYIQAENGDIARDYLPYFTTKFNIQEQIETLRKHNRPIGEMISIGLFYFSPYTLRTRIYRDFEFGNYSWLFGAKQQIGSFINGIGNASMLPAIAENLYIDKNKGKTFKYIHTFHTHYPFALTAKDCTPMMKAPTLLPDEYKPFIPNANHYDNEICAIKESIKIIEFLKKNNIYDNTMIILVSDHSYNDLPAHNKPYQPSLGNNPNPLLMIKDLQSKGKLIQDNSLMSNADVYGILCEKFAICKEKDIRNYPPPQREIIHTMNIHWTEKSHLAKHLLFEKIWKVKDNVLNPKNWIEITNNIDNKETTNDTQEEKR